MTVPAPTTQQQLDAFGAVLGAALRTIADLGDEVDALRRRVEILERVPLVNHTAIASANGKGP